MPMNVHINQFFTEPGFAYPFTGIFVGWMELEVSKRIQASKKFLEKYSKDHGLCFFLDARPGIAAPHLNGPTVRKRDKEVQFSIILPHAGGPMPKEATEYVQPVKLLVQSIAAALEKVEIDSSQILQDLPTLIQYFVSTPKLIRSDS